MDPSAPKPAARSTFLADAALTLAAFGFFTWILRTHVPSRDPFNVWLWGAISASCLAALFWLALQMFRAVLRAQRSARRK
jgi:FtsH-binding integral membrane protein